MSDLSILRWRIEQQSEMIMKMKTSLDESTEKMKMRENINEETRSVTEIVSSQLHGEEQRVRKLERDFGKVSVKYNHLLKMRERAETAKLEMKQYIARIEKESMNSLSTLAEETFCEVRDKKQLISSAQISLCKLESICNQLKLSNETDSLIQETEVLQAIQDRTKAELAKIKDEQDMKLKSVIGRLKTVEHKRAVIADMRHGEMEMYCTQNEEMKESIDEKHKDIKDEKILQSSLEQQEVKLKKKLEAVETKFRTEKHLIDTRLRIKKLKEELQKANEENQKALKKFAAYQKHAERLIEREAELNRRFSLLDNLNKKD